MLQELERRAFMSFVEGAASFEKQATSAGEISLHSASQIDTQETYAEVQNNEGSLKLVNEIFGGLGPQAVYRCQTFNIGGKLQEVTELPPEQIGNALHLISQTFGLAAGKNPSQASWKTIHKRSMAILSHIKSTLPGQKLPVLVLDQILGLQKCQSNHVTIAISSFLGHDDDATRHWEGLTEHFAMAGQDKTTQ